MAFTPTDPRLPDVSLASFDPGQVIDNPYAPFGVGDLRSFTGTEEGSGEIIERGDIFVTAEIRMIEGVRATVVRDTVYDADGRPLEDTLDWFAQDTDGAVWYLGEVSYEYAYDEESGAFLGTALDGSWEWGVDGALPGLFRPATSVVGDSYYQELYLGEAEDAAQVLATDETVAIDFGAFADVIRTFDFSTSDPEAREFKYAAAGVGVILEEGLGEDDEVEDTGRLIAVRTVGPAAGEADDIGLVELEEGAPIAPDELDRADFEEEDAESETRTVTYLGGVDDLDNAIGVYAYDIATGEIGEGRILFASSDRTSIGARRTVDVAAGQGLGVFVISNAHEAGLDIAAFKDGGLFFRNIATDAVASLSDRLAPVAADAAGNLLPFTVLHALDGAEDGMNLLNQGGGVQATELETVPNDAGDDLEEDSEEAPRDDDEDGVVLLGFEERMVTDTERDGDYNDVVLAVSEERLSRTAAAELAAMFGSEIFAHGGKRDDRLVGAELDDILFGLRGDDKLVGRNGDDILRGNSGDDVLKGGLGDDIMNGAAGDDLIYGGGGRDVARYRGDADGYEIARLTGNRISVTDIDASDGDFGMDMLKNVEILRFDDMTIA